jgi:hypothetical protein
LQNQNLQIHQDAKDKEFVEEKNKESIALQSPIRAIDPINDKTLTYEQQ